MEYKVYPNFDTIKYTQINIQKTIKSVTTKLKPKENPRLDN